MMNRSVILLQRHLPRVHTRYVSKLVDRQTASAFADMQMNNKTVDDADVMDMLLPWDNYTSNNNKAPPRRRKKGGLKKNTGGGLANSRRQSDPSFDHIFLEEGNAMTSGKNNPIR